MNIVDEIRRRGWRDELTAVREGGREIGFGELFELVDGIAGGLRELECYKRGGVARVGVIFPSGVGYICVALAILEAGGCLVPVPEELTAGERGELIGRTGVEALLIGGDAGGMELPGGLGRYDVVEVRGVETEFPIDGFERLNPAFVRFSSGTTGESKGVVISHESLLERILGANGGLGLSAGDKVLWTLPMAHHFAVTIILYLYHGVATVLEDANRPEVVLRAARESGTNLLYGSPMHFAQLVRCGGAGAWPELRMAVATATGLGRGVAERFREIFGVPLTQALGIIEVGLPVMNIGGEVDDPEALGRALEGYEARVAEDGELMLRGPGMFDAYLSPWRTREDVLAGGWFATGDLVEISAEGRVRMKGRKKSVINVGGMKVFPEEIEAVLDGHPGVGRSRVYGVEHPALGAYPCAEIVVADGRGGGEGPGAGELREYLRERLASYKVPMRIEMVKAIALTASGKIKRV